MTTGEPEGDGHLDATRVLSLCDRLLEETGRRDHLFAWLRTPGDGAGGWLPVDAYYPAHRLVVVLDNGDPAREALCSELVPAHGLRLLRVSPDGLDPDEGLAELAIAREIDGLVPPPPPGPSPARPQTAGPRQGTAHSRRRAPAPPSAPSHERETAGVVAGLALTAAVALELYFGVVRAGLDAGRVVLAFGLALDCCVRAVGTLCAGRAGDPDWAWLCALGGSPLVAGYAFRDTGRPPPEPAPLAGMLGLLAIAVVLIGLIT